MFVSRGLVVGFTVALAGVLLAGCGTRLNKAPVEDRGTSSNHASSPSVQPGTVVATPIKPLPGAENAGKPGYYTVKPGDTLIRIGLETGQGWKDIARWNNLENPNLIEVGQVLRVTSTVPAPPSAAAAAVAADTGVVTRPVASSSAQGAGFCARVHRIGGFGTSRGARCFASRCGRRRSRFHLARFRRAVGRF